MEDTGPPMRTIIVDDDPIVRRMIRDSLQEVGFTVIAEASNGREAIELANHYKPDIVLMDIVMPTMDGIEATRAIHATAPDTKIVMLTMSQDEELGILGLRAGASGYISKDDDLTDLPAALERVVAGDAAVSPALTLKLIERLRAMPEGGVGMRPVRSPLTSREWEVLDALSAGGSTDSIADEFVLSTETVRSHIKNILRKLDVHSQAEAIEAAKKLRQQGFADSQDGD